MNTFNEYIQSIKNRKTWVEVTVGINWSKQRDRFKYIENLPADELKLAMSFVGIETLSHLALHFLISAKHGRQAVRKRINELNLDVKDALHKGVHIISRTPQHWPTKYIGLRNILAYEIYWPTKYIGLRNILAYEIYWPTKYIGLRNITNKE
jgi:hypothetical protein